MVRVGTSGWVHPHWRGAFYPAELPQDRWLEYYRAYFDVVEPNKSFYNLPTFEQFASWKAQVPAGFRFAIKAK
ncbi:MAG: DUF72 domain-containing protein [Spirochaetota bacterium]